MEKQIKILAPSVDVTDLVIELSQVDGIGTSIKEESPPKPDERREHGAYILDTASLVTIIVSVSSITTSALGMATALLNYLTEKKKAEAEKAKVARETKESKEPSMSINNTFTVKLVFVNRK